MTLKGTLVIVAVLIITTGILAWMRAYIIEDTRRSLDTSRMRTIYRALYLYETSDDGTPPPDLVVVRRTLGNDEWLKSVGDPWPSAQKTAASPPLDPAFPDRDRSPVRISFTYLPLWARYGAVTVKDWQSEMKNLHIGILACYWYGDIDRLNADGHRCSGQVVRINMDGSARTFERLDKGRLTARDMFGIRP